MSRMKVKKMKGDAELILYIALIISVLFVLAWAIFQTSGM
jgi:hypothetical protein